MYKYKYINEKIVIGAIVGQNKVKKKGSKSEVFKKTHAACYWR